MFGLANSLMACILLGMLLTGTPAQGDTMNVKSNLTAAEEAVIVHKGTEPPFTGKFYKYHEPGVYVCRRCRAALYRSDDKFDSNCGWPSFDNEVPGAVLRLPDPDGQRTEIECAHCQAHLGHVFTGERVTARDVRHCVNSISLDFVPRDAVTNAFSRAVFAGGCFWGVEYYFQREPGVIYATSGYIGGTTEKPTYEQVCRHTTGHAEAVEVVFDPLQTSFEKMARLFFEIHDPCQLNQQGPDVGDQYRSAVFYMDAAQKQTTEKLIAELKKQGLAVVTQVVPAGTFWPAEAYHQDYYQRSGKTPYCHFRVKRFKSLSENPLGP